MIDVGYCIGVDVCPDRREEAQAEYESEQIAQGKAVRCSVCGDLVYRRQLGFESELCQNCAENEVRETKRLLRKCEELLNRDDKQRLRMLLSFLGDEVELDGTVISPADLLTIYYLEG